MNNMNLRRPNDFGRKMNCNFNQNGNSSNNSNCNTKPTPAFDCGFDTSCNMERGSNRPSCGCGNDKPSCGCNPGCDADSSLYNDPLKGMALAIGYVPWQQWCKVYDLCKGLQQGTIFPPLDLPFYGCIPRGYCKGQWCVQ